MSYNNLVWFVINDISGSVIKRPIVRPENPITAREQIDNFQVTAVYPKGSDIALNELNTEELFILRRKAQNAGNKLLSLDLFVHCNAITGAHAPLESGYSTATSECRTEQAKREIDDSCFLKQEGHNSSFIPPTEQEKKDITEINLENAYPKTGERKHPISLMAALGFDKHPILIVHPTGCARIPAINDNVVRLVHEIRKLDCSRKIVIQAYDEKKDGPTRSFMAEMLCSGICIRVLAGSMVYEKLRGHEDPIGASVTF